MDFNHLFFGLDSLFSKGGAGPLVGVSRVPNMEVLGGFFSPGSRVA